MTRLARPARSLLGPCAGALLLLAAAPSAAQAQDLELQPIPNTFRDLTLTEESVQLPLDDGDEFGIGVQLGFTFPFFGQSFTQVVVTTNGYLTFGTAINPLEEPIPSDFPPNGLIAPFWDDLDLRPSPSAKILFERSGEPGQRVFCVQWHEVASKQDPAARLTFQALLFETGEIQFRYGPLQNGDGTRGAGRAAGSSATIGIEAPSGARGVAVGYHRELVGGPHAPAFAFLPGAPLPQGRATGDLDGDGEVTILDQSRLAELGSPRYRVATALELVAADVAPLASSAATLWGDAAVDAADRDALSFVIVRRAALGPYLSELLPRSPAPGATLTLTGSRFAPFASDNVITFPAAGGTTLSVPAATVNAAGTELTVTLPEAARRGEVYVTVAGERRTNARPLGVAGVSAVLAITPPVGILGETVTIDAVELPPSAAELTVTIGGVAANVIALTPPSGGLPARLTVRAPLELPAGHHPVVVTRTDGPSSEPVVHPFGDLPTAELALEAGAEFRTHAPVLGTASDPTDLVRYELAYAPLEAADDPDAYVPFQQGVNGVVGGELGVLDPTGLINGYYALRLRVVDALGLEAVDDAVVSVQGNFKLGVFTLSFLDLELPASGIAIRVLREYDSRDKESHDFGYGWRLNLATLDLEENLLSHDVTVHNPAHAKGRVEYRFDPEPADFLNVRHFARFTTVDRRERSTLDFVPPEGVPRDAFIRRDGVGNWFWEAFGLPFDPELYTIHQLDGTVLEVHDEEDLKRVVKPTGVTLTITRDGIIHSAGRSVKFVRDSLDRITQVTDPNGSAQRYEYDERGDLVAHVDGEGFRTTFTYLDAHYLDEWLDPRGVRCTKNEYDELGRLIATVDAQGNRLVFEHDTEGRREVTYDRLGRPTVTEYDELGRVTRITGPDGFFEQFELDALGRIVERRDRNGQVWSFTYDALGNQSSQTDPEGNEISYTYDARGNLTSVTDADGGVWQAKYDSANRLLEVIDPAGGVTTRTYDADGNLLSQRDPNGDTTTLTYDDDGDLASKLDPAGKRTLYEHDGNGRLTQRTEIIAVSGQPAVRATTSYEYDANGQRVRTTYPDGSFVAKRYAFNGRVAHRSDSQGRSLTLSYDQLGNLVERIGQDGSVERREYDANNNLIAVVDASGRREAEVDERGQVTRLRLADGSTLHNEYDPVGNLVAHVDADGGRWEYEYDGAGRCVLERDPTGAVERKTYNGKGDVTSVEDADGHVTRFEYDPCGRLIKTVFPDGSTEVVERDAAGRVLRKTDGHGRVTEFAYGAFDDQQEVTLGAGFTRYTYDSRGSVLTQTDLGGRTTSYGYDPLTGKRTSKTLPLGQTATYSYEDGVLSATTDFNGNRTELRYDGHGNRVFSIFADGTGERITYDARGEHVTAVANRHGETRYRYDPAGRLVERLEPTRAHVRYEHDARGNVTRISTPAGSYAYGHDGVGRVTSITDVQGGVTTIAYTAAGRLSEVRRPNGVTTKYTFDPVGRLTRLVHEGPSGVVAGYTYEYHPSGNRSRAIEDSGRVVAYEYDESARLTRETITEGGQTTTIAYTYDRVGNRLTKSTERPDGSTESVTYAYDANDRLLEETVTDSAVGTHTISYAYDANGNTLSRTAPGEVTTYGYDPRNRLVSVRVERGGAVADELAYRYDHLGNLVQTVRNGQVINHLVDTNRPWAQILLDTDAEGNVLATFAYDRRFPLSRTGPDGVTEYLLADGQLSVRTLTDAAGQVCGTYTYDAFGAPTASSGSSANELRYGSERFEPATGLYYLRSRWLDPRTGRFLTRDTFEGFYEEPISLHPYVYVQQNPVNRLDPPGTFGWCLMEVVAVDIPMMMLEFMLAYYELKAELAELARRKNLQGILDQLNMFLPDALDVIGSDQDFLLAQGLLVRATRDAARRSGSSDDPDAPRLPLAAKTYLFGAKVYGRAGSQLDLAAAPKGTTASGSAPSERLEHDKELYGDKAVGAQPGRVVALSAYQELRSWLEDLEQGKQIKDLHFFEYQLDAAGNQVGWNRPPIAWTVASTGVRWNVCFTEASSPSSSQVDRIARNDPHATALELRSDAEWEEIMDAIRWNGDMGPPAPSILSLAADDLGSLATRKEAIPFRNKRLPLPTNQVLEGSGVIASNGEFYLSRTDLKVQGRGLSWQFSRTYRSGVVYPDDPENDLVTDFHLGHGWSTNYDTRLANNGSGSLVSLDGEAGRYGDLFQLLLDRILGIGEGAKLDQPQAQYAPPPGVFDSVTQTLIAVLRLPRGATEPVIEVERGYIQRAANGEIHVYNADGWLIRLEDRHGNEIQLVRDVDNLLRLAIDDLGRRYRYEYTAFDHHQLLTAVVDETGDRAITFEYDPETYDLVKVTSPGGRVERYSYSKGHANPALNHNMTEVYLPDQGLEDPGVPAIVNAYQETDPASYDFDSVVSQRHGGTSQRTGLDGTVRTVASGGTYTFTYEETDLFSLVEDPDARASTTTVLDPRGYTRAYVFNKGGNPLQVEDEADLITTHRYNEDGLRIYTRTPGGQEEFLGYDGTAAIRAQRSNLIAMVVWPAPPDPEAPSGDEPAPVLTEFDYDPFFNQLRRTSESPAFERLTAKPDLAEDPHRWFTPDPERYQHFTSVKTFDYQEGPVPLLPRQLIFKLGYERDAILAVREQYAERWQVTFEHGDLNADGRVGPHDLSDWGGRGFSGDPVHVLKRVVRRGGEEPQEIATRYQYNDDGQVAREIDAEGNVTSYAYYPGGEYEPGSGAQPGYVREIVVDDFPVGSGPVRTSATAPVRATTRFEYDAFGNVRRRLDPRGVVYTSVYDPDNLLVEGRRALGADALGYVTKVTNGPNRKPTRVEIEDRGAIDSVPGRKFVKGYVYGLLDEVLEEGALLGSRWLVTRHEYDAGTLRTASVTPLGNRVEWTYDGRKLRTAETRGAGSPEASTTAWTYDANKNEQTVVLPDDDVVRYEYDGLNRRVATIRPDGSVERLELDALGKVLRQQVYGFVGGPTPSGNDQSRNVLLAETRFDLDDMHRVTAVRQLLFRAGTIAPPEEIVTRTEYDRLGRIVAQVEPDGERREVDYDGLGRAVVVRHALGNREELEYDPNGNLLTRREVESATVPEIATATFTTTFTYDALNRLTSTRDDAGQVTTVAYDSRDKPVRVVDAEGNVRTYRYDMVGRKTLEECELRVGGTGAGALDTANPHNPDGRITLAYGWDDDSRLISITDDNGNATRREYDALGRRTAEVLADGARTTFTYNDDDTVTRVVDANGTVSTRRYDVRDRLVETTVARAEGVIGTTHEAYEYDGLGRVTRCTDDGGGSASTTTVYTYDSLGRVLEERQGGASIAYTWTQDSKRDTVTYPGGRTLHYAYDEVDHPVEVSDARGVIARSEFAGPGLRLLRRTHRNGTVLDFEQGYDAVRRIVRLRHRTGPGEQAFVDREYGYNRVGYRTFERRHDDHELTDRYTYDSMYRLASTALDQASDPEQPPAGATRRETAQLDYVLDGVGNRRSVAVTDADGSQTTESYSVNERNQYTARGGAARRHDANGNLIEDERFVYRYDYRNRLAAVARRNGEQLEPVVEYGYDCKNRRVRKVAYSSVAEVGTTTVTWVGHETRYCYDGWRLCEERDEQGQTLVTYVHDARFLDEVCQIERTAAHPLGAGELYVHQDARFNVVALTDASGAVVERRFYDDFGNAFDAAKEPATESAVGNPFGFQGARLDSETGLYDFRNRVYDPATGRFLQVDPAWDPGNVGNAYTFAWNNPTSLSDPEGTLVAALAMRTSLRMGNRALLRSAKHGAMFGLRRVRETLVARAGNLAVNMLFEFLEPWLDELLSDAVDNGQLGLVYGGNTGTEAPLGGLDAHEVVGESFDNCFLAGTLVDTTTRGRVRVEEVQEGDHIAPPPGHEGCTNPRCGRVEQLFRNTTSEVVTITAVTRPRARERRSGGAGGGGEEGASEDGEPPSASLSQTIRCTPGHPFFVEGRGWVFAGDLLVGDVFEARGERVEVGAVETRAEQAQTFNFEVACHHTYFVAGSQTQPGVLVHNVSLRGLIGRGSRLMRDVRRGAGAAFKAGGKTLGSFFRRAGKRTEDLGDAVLGQFKGRGLTSQEGYATAGGSIIDRFLSRGPRSALLEIKYSIPGSGGGFDRLAKQIRHMVGEGQHAVVWSLRRADPGALRRLQRELGEDVFNRVQFVEGVRGLHNWTKFYFGRGPF